MNYDKYFHSKLYQEILLEINIQRKKRELLALIKYDDRSSCSNCSRINCTCPRKSVSDSGIDENMSDDNVCDDKCDFGNDIDANAVFENFRMFFTNFSSPPAKTLPRPQWPGTNNEETGKQTLESLESSTIHVNKRAWTNSFRDDTDEESFGASTTVYSLKNGNLQIIKNYNQQPSNKTTITTRDSTARDSTTRDSTTRDSTTVTEFFKHFAFSGSQSTSPQTAPIASESNANTKLNPFY